MNLQDKVDALREEALAATALDAYYAVNGLWLVLVKAANLLPRNAEEHEQVASLLRQFNRSEAARVVATDGIDSLLNLDPPLETFLAEPGERLQARRAQKELTRIRQLRSTDPKAALAVTFELLQRIRDKREHGFKSPKGTRSSEILSAAVSILLPMVDTAHKVSEGQRASVVSAQTHHSRSADR
jgi:hypothetical protein